MELEHIPRSVPLYIRLGGEARVAQIVYRLLERMRVDPVLEVLVRGVCAEDLCESPLDAAFDRLYTLPERELHLHMIIGHLVATLVDLNVGPGPMRDVVRLVEDYKRTALAA